MKTENLLKLNRGYVALALFCLFYLPSNLAQTNNAHQNLVEKYPGEFEIVVDDHTNYQIKLKKGQLNILQKSYSENMILNVNGIGSYKEQFYSSQLSPVIDYNAYTIKADNSKVKTDLTTVSSSGDGSIFFDDVQKTEITYTDLEPGAKKILETTTEFIDPALLHQYIFQSHLSAVNMKFTVEVDEGVELGYRVFNNENEAISFDQSKKGSKTIYTWSAKDIKPFSFEANQPGLLYDAPHVAIYIKSYEEQDKKIRVLGEVSDLFNYYNKFVKDLNQVVDSRLKTITNELIEGVESEEEKVRRIYYWVKDNIKYIAYENGYEGFIPREASFVCERKFGDCKDMASIITAMCNYAGVEDVKIAWIGTRDLPYTYEKLPTPASDNHMIAAYVKPNNIIYLDATDQFSSFGLCSSFIQGKEALIRLGANDFIVREVPVIPPSTNKIHTTIDAVIDQSQIVGSGQMNYSGLSRAITLARMNRSNEQRLFNQIKSRTRLGNNKYILDEYEEINQAERDSVYRINFDYHLDNYLVSLDDEIYVNLFLKKLTQAEVFDADRDRAMEYELASENAVAVHLDLASTYDIEEIPEPFTIENDLVLFKSVYHRQDDILSLNYQLVVKKILVEKSDFELWNDSVEQIVDNMKETITLNKIK